MSKIQITGPSTGTGTGTGTGTVTLTSCLWDSPVPYPADGKKYQWDEATTSWIEMTE